MSPTRPFIRLCLLFGVLLSANGLARAEWATVATRGEGDVLYADTAAKVVNGPLVRVSSLMDYGKPQLWGVDKRFNSTKAQWELNCQTRTYRTLSYSAHTEKKGAGEAVVAEAQASNWSPATEASIPGDLLRWACK